MKKLRPQVKFLKEFKEHPSVSTAHRFLKYLDEYPMAETLLNDEDKQLREQAWEMVTGG